MENEKRLIDANDIVKVAEHAYNEWNLAMAAADGQRQINLVYKMKELCKAVKAVADAAPTVDAVEVKCKVGDWVYALWEAPVKQKYIIYCAEVKEIRIGMRNCRLTTTYRLEPIMYRGHIHEYGGEDFGKLVFPSEKEAEAALAKMDGGNEDGRKNRMSVL